MKNIASDSFFFHSLETHCLKGRVLEALQGNLLAAKISLFDTQVL